MTHLALMLVRAGIGPISFLEAFWLLAGLACLKDCTCLLWDARAQLVAATAPPVDETLEALALIDYRGALQAVLVQLCFLAVGLIAAFRPPPPVPTDGDDALAEIATIAFFLTIQVANVIGTRDRRRHTQRIDRDIQDMVRLEPKPGGKRWYDAHLDRPSNE